MADIKIVYDWREKKPWSFDGAQEVELESGDYAPSGFEDRIAVERKGTIQEIALNFSKRDRDRFEGCLERLSRLDHAIIVVERPLSALLAYPFIEDVPPYLRKKIKVRGPYLLKLISESMAKWGVPFVFCKDAKEAQKFAESWLKACYHEESPADESTGFPEEVKILSID